LYVDFGNKEVLSKNQLRVLDADFMDVPIQCYRCRLNDVIPVCTASSADVMITVLTVLTATDCGFFSLETLCGSVALDL